MTRYVHAGLSLLLCCAGISSRSYAQGNSQTTIQNCDVAARFVRNGVPSHKQLPALEYLARCGEAGARVLAETILQTRSEDDVDALNAFYQRVQVWRDSSVMEAASHVARDPTAVVPSRIFAIGYLLWLVNPGYQYPYGKLAEGIAVPHLPCVAGYTSEHPSTASAGSPLPQNHAARIGTTLHQLSIDPTSPRPVRNAASCIDF